MVYLTDAFGIIVIFLFGFDERYEKNADLNCENQEAGGAFESYYFTGFSARSFFAVKL